MARYALRQPACAPPAVSLWQRFASRSLPGLAIALAGLFAAVQLSKWPTRVRYPGELEMAEGIVLAEMTLLREGEPVYAPASPESFRSMIYGPLYYLIGSRSG